ncbi:CRP-like cAMP-binding protein [Neolewinella xylanilytica]|uniref:CRP-like cAMP-binding protein n=1 Tax=Neolewinella xylanilytica TaxID=1514080 RepID=A0A2S6I8F7_9BACT|nr:Crp/Fnr family transcriptional regulator [Neolewinella xylanilytica]PPK87773.1 CRP-like cAMP-binding protein [Neolewinella xylanilytica]
MNTLTEYFRRAGFARPAAETIAARFTPRLLARGEDFVRPDRVADSLAYLESGQLRYFTVDTRGEERTTYISLAGSFAASLLSFLNRTPAPECIRAVTDSQLWTIDRQQLQALRTEVAGFGDFYTGLLEWQICCIDKGRFDLITLTAEERYHKMLREEPELFREVPLQYLASMLAITPRHLSRLRAKK